MTLFDELYLLWVFISHAWHWGPWSQLVFVSIAIALILDATLGEPSGRWHPVMWMGRALHAVGEKIAPAVPHKAEGQEELWRPSELDALEAQTHLSTKVRLQRVLMGSFAWGVGAALVLAVAVTLQLALFILALRYSLWLAAIPMAILLKPLFAYRMLLREVHAADLALERSLPEGRRYLATLVSRNTCQLTATEVREALIATLAENFNDSVVAPLFWFSVAGLPGAALYRWANTADAMWGYRGEHNGRDWTHVGRFAARADDVLSWIPARITAYTLVATNSLVKRSFKCHKCWRKIPREASKTPSPNSGWPMAAMAVLLNIRLNKPGVYHLLPQGRLAAPNDVTASIDLCRRCWRSLMAMALTAAAFSVLYLG